MSRSVLRLAAIGAALLASVACESTKSANPLSPTVAGPIPGVNISAPKLLEPGSGWTYKPDKQPITLLLENASSNGQRPLTYVFQIASDAAFSNVVFTREGITPGDGGRTALKLPDALASGRTYYWRARAQDGANTGPFTDPVAFVVLQPISFQAPVPISPVNGQTIGTVTPNLRWQNAGRSGPVGEVSYRLEVSLNDSFSSIVWWRNGGELAGATEYAVPTLQLSTTYYWRVRAFEPETTGPWSATAVFKTPGATAPPPPSGGGGGGGTPGSCAFNDGERVVECVEDKYPERLRPVGSLAERNANMEWLRDRILENAICGGLDVAWNLKRGVGPRSIDAIAWRRNGRIEVVDIGQAYDALGDTLNLQWAIVGGTPGWDPFPRPNCQ